MVRHRVGSGACRCAARDHLARGAVDPSADLLRTLSPVRATSSRPCRRRRRSIAGAERLVLARAASSVQRTLPVPMSTPYTPVVEPCTSCASTQPPSRRTCPGGRRGSTGRGSSGPAGSHVVRSRTCSTVVSPAGRVVVTETSSRPPVARRGERGRTGPDRAGCPRAAGPADGAGGRVDPAEHRAVACALPRGTAGRGGRQRHQGAARHGPGTRDVRPETAPLGSRRQAAGSARAVPPLPRLVAP